MRNRVLIAAAAATLIAEAPVISLVVETWSGLRDKSSANADKAWAKDKDGSDRGDGGGKEGRGEGGGKDGRGEGGGRGEGKSGGGWEATSGAALEALVTV